MNATVMNTCTTNCIRSYLGKFEHSCFQIQSKEIYKLKSSSESSSEFQLGSCLQILSLGTRQAALWQQGQDKAGSWLRRLVPGNKLKTQAVLEIKEGQDTGFFWTSWTAGRHRINSHFNQTLFSMRKTVHLPMKGNPYNFSQSRWLSEFYQNVWHGTTRKMMHVSLAILNKL